MNTHLRQPNFAAVGATQGRRSGSIRRGVAATEAAVTLPVLIVLAFGCIEMANAIFMRQSLNMAAYEAAKVVTRPGSNDALARTRCAQVLAMRRVTDFTMTVSPAITTASPRGIMVTVTVTAPAGNLSYGPLRFMSGATIRSQVCMVRL